MWGLDLSQTVQGAGGIGGLLAKVESGATHAYLYDGNGNVGQLINAATGSVDAQYEYDAYGNSIVASGTQATANPFRFSTKYLDSESGLYYYGYRYYDPETGRWTNRDPIGEEGGLNLYAFVINNPTNSFDLFGLTDVLWWSGYIGTKAHGLFFEWIRTQKGFLPPVYYTDQRLDKIGYGKSRLKPDLIKIGRIPIIWELKPITHMKSTAWWLVDDIQVKQYLDETCGKLGDPTHIVKHKSGGTSIGTIVDLQKEIHEVLIYPGRKGFIYYRLKSDSKKRRKRNVAYSYDPSQDPNKLLPFPGYPFNPLFGR